MKLKHIAAMAVSLILVAGPLSADAGDFYLGASIGNATLNEDFDGLTVDDNSTAFRIVAGCRFSRFTASIPLVKNRNVSRAAVSAPAMAPGLSAATRAGEHLHPSGWYPGGKRRRWVARIHTRVPR